MLNARYIYGDGGTYGQLDRQGTKQTKTMTTESPMHRATGPLIQRDAQLLQRYRHELVEVDTPRGQLRFAP